ncbi:aldo/keto reductase [Demequina sp.]|uniref:aldo/keto reductase n=1 Tax=Demequina sp. TaxID=2050685 RepID=UPI0025C0DDB0|nr:aldo/keto reductase [Demequina sp.]
MSIPQHTLNDGHRIPAIGFGTYPLVGKEGYDAVRSALDNGYRLIDTAVNYENEGTVGRAIRDFVRESGVDRSEITVQTKLPGRHHHTDRAIKSGYESLQRLGLDQIDVLLIHWPNPIAGTFVDAWRGLVRLRERGIVRSIGVSNFTESHLESVIADSGVTPVINQIELHPLFTQEAMRAVHDRLGIVTESWSPLGKSSAPFAEGAVAKAADAHGVTPAQVVLRWQVQLGNVPLPKSANAARQAANLDVFTFSLSEDEMTAVSALNRTDGRLFGGDPTTHEEM